MLLRLKPKALFFFSFILCTWWTLNGVVSGPPQTAPVLYLKCSKHKLNDVSDVSSFHENLNTTLGDLREQVSKQSKHFATAQSLKGHNPIPAYALFQCRNYLSISDCLACFDSAAVNLRNCSVQSKWARILYDDCFLRYHSRYFFNLAKDYPSSIFCGKQITKKSTMLISRVQEVLTNLKTAIPRNPNFFAATKTLVPNSNGSYVYAFAQCAESASQSGCQDCLYHSLMNLQTCLPNSSSARSYDAGCCMRYSTTAAFFADNQTIDINHFLKQGSSNKGAIIGEVFGGVAFALILLALFAWIRLPKHTKGSMGDIIGATNLNGLVTYSYKELEYATNNFGQQNKLGEGGFGAVYKGNLKNGQVVAIKKLNLRNCKRMEEDFESEVKLISNVHHRNLIRLLGYCVKDCDRILVYEYMKNNSLDKFIFGKRKGSLNWKQRFDIILGMARGLAYLHEELHVRIIHRDIKPNNILLDDDLQPKIADFGLAKLLHEEKYHRSTNFAGTLGYAAPEYAVHGQLSEKVDVYSYGVVILEIISSQKSNELKINGDAEVEFLLQKAWKLYASGVHLELVDNTLKLNDFDEEEVKNIIKIGLLCVQESAALRPTMSEVVASLRQYRGLVERPSTMY